MSSYQVYKDKALRNPEVKKEYDITVIKNIILIL